MYRAVFCFAILVFLSACAPSQKEVVVREEPDANLYLTIASKTKGHPTTGVTVTIDGILAVTIPGDDMDDSVLSVYRLHLEPGTHQLVARAHKGRVKKSFRVKTDGGPKWVTLLVYCGCEGEHSHEGVGFIIDVSDEPHEYHDPRAH